MDPQDSPRPLTATLAERAGARDASAWNQLLRLYAPLVYQAARSSGLAPAESSTLTLGVFRSVWESLPHTPWRASGQSFRGWLQTLTAEALSRAVGLPGNPAEAAVGGDLFASLPDRALQIVQDSVTAPVWQAFSMTVVEGLDTDQAASRLGLPSSEVRQARYQVLYRLRSLLIDS